MTNRFEALFISVLTILVFFLTIIPQTRSIINSMFVLYIVVATVGFIYYPFAKKYVRSERTMRFYVLIMFVSLLLWVGVTGWFFSPFFYLLYLIAIVLSFMYSPFVTLAFVMTLLGLFSPNIGSIDMTIDIVTVISLFSVVPLTYYLQKEYLRLKQHEKKVLILDDDTRKLRNQVDEVLKNKIIKFAAELRQPVNDMKQVAYVAQKEKNNPKVAKSLKEIIKLGETSLKGIEKFEEHVTGKKLLHTKR